MQPNHSGKVYLYHDLANKIDHKVDALKNLDKGEKAANIFTTPSYPLNRRCLKGSYSGPSLKEHSKEDTPLERTQIFGSKYSECI